MKPGLVFLDNDCFRPFSRHREIRRGRNKGRIGWQGTEEQYTRALQTSLDILKTQYLKYKKPEIAI